MPTDSGITLQFNLSPGDLDYARQTVRRLALSHQTGIEEKLAIVDCCRPQRTKFVDPDRRFPEAAFYQRVEEISSLAEELKREGCIDRIEYVRPRSSLIATLSSRYLAGAVRETHDAGACGLMAYFAAFELASTRYLVHYDADMILHQSASYEWVKDAVVLMGRLPKALCATPRISPPFAENSEAADAPSLHEGRPLVAVEGGWLNDWFSTRCFLMDLGKLAHYLPLYQGFELWATRAKRLLAGIPAPVDWGEDPRTAAKHASALMPLLRFAKYFAWRYGNPIYPLSPELMLFRRMAPAGGRCLQLSSKQAWLLHPASKPARFVELLPKVLLAVAAGHVPVAQRGKADIDLEAWESLFDGPESWSNVH